MHEYLKFFGTNNQQKVDRFLIYERALIRIVHVFGHLKTFIISASRYRNRGKRLGLIFNLIAGIYNFELSKKMIL